MRRSDGAAQHPRVDSPVDNAVDRVDTSTAAAGPYTRNPDGTVDYRAGLRDMTPILTGFPDGAVQFHDGRRPSFLAAPDDDCGACGHDRQAWHLPADAPCRAPAPYAPGGTCRCPAFVDATDPF